MVVLPGLALGAVHGVRAQEQPITIAPARPMPTPVARADNLMAGGNIEASLDLLETYLESHPNDFEARWRAARAAVYMGILATGTEIENRWYRRGIAHADRALAERPDDLEALRWDIAAKGSLAVQTGARETVRLAKDVYRLAHRLLELDPRNAFAYDALGSLDYQVMELNAFKRALGRLFLGADVLSVASWHDALEYHRRAVALDPNNLLYRVDLANTLAKTGHTAEAIEQLRVAVALPSRLPVDSDFRARAERRLKELQQVESERRAER
jgi:tetratricopeptide (TPR) repeat protein